MVRRLFKHEIISYLRTLLPVNLILIAIAVMGRIVQLFEDDGVIYTLAFGSAVFALGAAVIACIYMTFIIAIVRFYKNLFTAEGYLSFTLPITPAQHIWVKLLTAILFQVIAFVSIALSFMIFLSGEFLVEIFRAAGYLLSAIWSELGGHVILFAIEFILLLLVATAYSYLLWYACISLGQRSRKNRVLMAILAYFGYYMITQVVSTVFMIAVAVLGEFGAFDSIVLWAAQNPIACVHTYFAIYMLVMAGLSLLCFFISRSTMKNKLNLE